MKIAVRVDASQAIGTGHVRRCLALAQALQFLGAEVRFVTRDLELDTTALIAVGGFPARFLSRPEVGEPASRVPHADWAGVSPATDVQQTVEALRGWSPDWLVLDHYAFDAEWHEGAKKALGCRLAVIDDLADRSLAADLVVDQNYAADHRVKYAGKLGCNAALLGGPRFALLGPAYHHGPRWQAGETIDSIGVFMGGVDGDNLSARVIEAIERTGFAGEVEVVSTSANPHLPSLRAATKARPNMRLLTDLPDLAQFFARHGLQVGAGGSATWERCCVGAPSLLLVVADNQLAVIPALATQGAIATPEPLGATDQDSIAAGVAGLLADPARRHILSARSQALVDGLGARRVALHMLSGNLAVRPADIDDAELLHRWRNDPATRSVSRSREEIAWPDHLAWLERVLADPARRLMIGTVGRLPVGVIRFDRLDERNAEVSLYLDPAMHGLGLGAALLRAGEHAAHGLDIHAEVLEGNTGSARLFESAGYGRVNATHWVKPVAAGHERARDDD